jgi:hypothetical protein
MAKCPLYAQGQCDNGDVMTAHGLKIHMGKLHGVHYGGVVEVESAAVPRPVALVLGVSEESALVPCPKLFCKVQLPAKDMRAHWDRDHPTWLTHDGKYTWEV